MAPRPQPSLLLAGSDGRPAVRVPRPRTEPAPAAEQPRAVWLVHEDVTHRVAAFGGVDAHTRCVCGISVQACRFLMRQPPGAVCRSCTAA